MSTIGYTTTPSQRNLFYGLNVQNQAYIQSVTMPSPGGYVTALHGYFQTNQNGSATCYLAMWGGGGGTTLLASVAVSVTQGNHTPGGQGWQVGTLATPYWIPGGGAVNMGWEVPQNNGMTFTVDNTGASVVGTNSAALPNDLANVAFTGFGTLGIYADVTLLTAPTITGISPNPAPPGTQIVITGTQFLQASGVTIGGVAASFTVNSDTQITATVPSNVGGSVTVTVTNPAGSGSANLIAGQVWFGDASGNGAVHTPVAVWCGTGGAPVQVKGIWVPNGAGVKRIW